MKDTLLLLLLIILSSCGNNNTSTVSTTGNTAGFELSDVSGSNWQKAIQKGEDGAIALEGHFENGIRQGMWMEMDANGTPKKVFNYANGVLNGTYAEYNERGQPELICGYKNDQIDGRYAKYKFSRVEEEMYYKNGVLEGISKKYYKNKDQIQTETTHKNGKRNGPERYYNEEGKMTLEWIFKNGEKVSGGIVEEK